ncbi:hypothetical protein PHYC_02662 [Phycisphaerales bacterium]|nr:hypothetical protein PHYC_02662 [Phycisphaerales bacterium]
MPVHDGVVEFDIVIHARPSTVFRFFTDPARFARWWSAPGGGRATIDPRVGGAVRIEYQGDRAVMAGKVLEIVPERRFVFSWGYEKGNDAVAPGASRVEITLAEVAEGTRLTLRHLDLPTPEQQHGHEQGWRHYASCMARECAQDEFGERAGPAVEAWARAWNTTDPAARRAALAECVAPDVEFRDAFSAVRGLDVLNDHIGNATKHMPGMKLELAGPPRLCHAFVRFAWRVVGPDGKAAFSGENFGRFSPDGRLSLVVGFWG